MGAASLAMCTQPGGLGNVKQGNLWLNLQFRRSLHLEVNLHVVLVKAEVTLRLSPGAAGLRADGKVCPQSP